MKELRREMNNFSLKDGFKGEETRLADGHKN